MKLFLILLLSAVSAASGAETESYSVSAPDLTIELNANGEIISAVVGADRVPYQMKGSTGLVGSKTSGPVTVLKLPSGGVEFRRNLGSSGTITSRFQPVADSIQWRVKIVGANGAAPYSAPIDTTLSLKDADSNAPLFWSAWSSPQGTLEQSPERDDDHWRKNWDDPLFPQPFKKARFEYGSFHPRGGGISLPLAMFVDEPNGVAVSLIQSPADTFLTMDCFTYSDQKVVFSRKNHRIVSDNPIELNMDIVVHEPAPRAGLAWMVKKYPEFFDPPNPRAHEIAGGAGYSEYETPWNAEKLKKMSFRVNWKCSVDFPYMGMFLPPVGPAEKWNRFAGGARGRYKPADEGRHGQVSVSMLADYSTAMKADGFNVLSYFNMTEFGGNIIYPPPTGVADVPTTQPLWADPNAYLYTKFPDAILHGPDVRNTWGGAVAMDCGDPAYQAFLLDQAKRHINEIPDAAGICIDRLDWLNRYNRNADDGISWINNAPARYVGTSWNQMLTKLGPMMHDADKVIFANPNYNRISFFRNVDGIYDEKGNRGVALNAGAFVTLRKPHMIWTQEKDLEYNGPDAFLQRCLYMGANVTVPVPGNDHAIVPSPAADALFLRYGPLFSALHQRKWVLKPNPVSVSAATSTTKANVFEVPDGLIVPVMFGGGATEATITLRGFADFKAAECEAINPGKPAVPIKMTRNGNEMVFTTPLISGCAVVKIQARD